MHPKWWSVEVQCQICKIPAVINGVNFSADGELAISVTCPKCQENFSWHVFASALSHRALVNDLMANKVEKMCRNTPLQPPLAELPPPPEHLSKEDESWLKAMSIDPESGSLV